MENVLDEFGVTLNVGRGYDGWSSLRNASERFKRRAREGQDIYIAYLGDFDPSGEDMIRSLRERLGFFKVHPEIEKIAITRKDVDDYELPQAPGKPSDSRSAAFELEHGELIQVELDALPVAVLRERIKATCEEHMDMQALERTREIQDEENVTLDKLVKRMRKAKK